MSNKNKPAGYWRDAQNQRDFFDNLAKSLDITKPEDWSRVKLATVLDRGGWFVKDYYDSSLAKGIEYDPISVLTNIISFSGSKWHLLPIQVNISLTKCQH